MLPIVWKDEAKQPWAVTKASLLWYTLYNNVYWCPVWSTQTLRVRNRRFQRGKLNIFPKQTFNCEKVRKKDM